MVNKSIKVNSTTTRRDFCVYLFPLKSNILTDWWLILPFHHSESDAFFISVVPFRFLQSKLICFPYAQLLLHRFQSTVIRLFVSVVEDLEPYLHIFTIFSTVSFPQILILRRMCCGGICFIIARYLMFPWHKELIRSDSHIMIAVIFYTNREGLADGFWFYVLNVKMNTG